MSATSNGPAIQQQIGAFLEVLVRCNNANPPKDSQVVKAKLVQVLSLYPSMTTEDIGCCKIGDVYRDDLTKAECDSLGGEWLKRPCPPPPPEVEEATSKATE